jgi:filamentous hemagglutinin
MDHRGEFPEYKNEQEYVQGAKHFVNDPPAGTLTKMRPNGDKLFYNPNTNTFAVRSPGGPPRTMFRPTEGMEYWNRQ